MSEEVQICDVKEMLNFKQTDPDFVLDGTHFGRGDQYICKYSQKLHKYEVVELKQWKVKDNTLEPVPIELVGQFYNQNSYIVYAKFETKKFEMKSNNLLKDNDSTRETYFYWRGSEAPKGYSPLPKELNAENEPVERILQWSEFPTFVRLFNGTMLAHLGTHGQNSSGSHLYILRGTLDEEAHFFEIPCEKRNLRSRTSFLLVQPSKGKIFLWHGCKADQRNKNLISNITKKLLEYGASIYNVQGIKFELTDVAEGEDNSEFEQCLKGTKDDYLSLTDDTRLYAFSPRLFYFNSVTGSFLATGVQNALYSEFVDPFSFLQEHLYTAAQPGNIKVAFL